jgi:protein TonB
VRDETPAETNDPRPETEEPAGQPPPKPAPVSLEAELLPEEGELTASDLATENQAAPMAGLVELPSVPLAEENAPLPSPEEVEVVDTSAPKAQRGELVDFARLDVPPRAVVTSKPEYPRFAAMQGLTGKVFVNVLVAEDGTVAEARAVTGPHKILSKAAVDAIRSWRYTPPVKDGVQVKTWKTEIIVFK